MGATFVQSGDSIDWVADADRSAGDLVQVPDGRAGIVCGDVAAGDTVGVRVTGLARLPKTVGVVILPGSRVFWGASAGKGHVLHGGDKDFYAGAAQEEGASADTTILVALNVQPVYTLSLAHGFASVPINTAGFPFVHGTGEGVNLGFSATAEAQKVDALSFDKAAVAHIQFVDALVCVNTNGDAAAVDINIGLADGTNATDADSITASLFCHIDGGSANINFESDDGTADVAAVDSTLDFTPGTPFLVQWDLRDPDDVQVYVNGVNVLPDTVFKLAAAANPLRLLAHMEKTSDDSPGNVSVLLLGARTGIAA